MAFQLPAIQKNGEYGSVKIKDIEYSAHGDKACCDGYGLKISSGAVRARKKRELLIKYPSGTAMCRIDTHLAIASEDALYLDGKKLCTLEKSSTKSFCTLGKTAYLIPDLAWCNVESGEWGKMREKWQGDVSFEARQGMHSIILNSDDYFNFTPGDRLRISGCTTYPHNNKVITVIDAEKDELRFPTGSFTLGVEYGTVTIERVVPNFTSLFSCGGRLWGLIKDRIYVSSLENPLLFSYENELDDTWNKTHADGGDFTGGCDMFGTAYLFKDESVWCVTGNSPAEYEISRLRIPALAENQTTSLCATAKGICYYGVEGLVSATPSSYEIIGDELPEGLENTVCAALGGRLGVSGKKDGRYYTFIRENDGSWSPQNDVCAVGMTQYNGNAIFLSSDGSLLRENASCAETPESVFESRDIYIGRKTAIERLELDLKLESPNADETAVADLPSADAGTANSITPTATADGTDTTAITATSAAELASGEATTHAADTAATAEFSTPAELASGEATATADENTPSATTPAVADLPSATATATTASVADTTAAEAVPSAEIFISCDGGEYRRIASFTGERQGEFNLSLKGLKAARVKLKLHTVGSWCLRAFSLYYKKPT